MVLATNCKVTQPIIVDLIALTVRTTLVINGLIITQITTHSHVDMAVSIV